MNRGKIGVATALVVAVLAALGWWNRGGDDTAAGGPPFGGGARGPVAVEVAEVVRGPFVPRTSFVGTLEARAAAQLAARSAGPLVAVSADVGDRVRRGQALARVDAADEGQRREQARAALRIAEATLSQRRAALGIAETTTERTAALLAQSLVPQQQYDAVAAELEGVRAQVELAQAQIEQARAALSAAEVALEQTLVVAPFDGVVARRYLDLGDSASQNDPVFEIADLSLIKVTVALPERQAARVQRGQPATVTVASLPEATFRGRVARVSDVLDPQSNTGEAQVEIENPDGRLKPGMFAEVSIALERREEALLVPSAAVLEEDGRHFVFVVAAGAAAAPDGDGAGTRPAAGPAGTVAQRREVTVLGGGAAGDAHTAVAGELEVGQRVVTLGQAGLADGTPIQVSDAPAVAGQRLGRDETAPPAAARSRAS